MLAGPAAHAQGTARIIEYRSPLDGSLQAYGVYLPAAPPPTSAGYPAVLHGHGYGWSVSANFSAFQRQWAEEHGWILINLNARGPNFYEGVGDVETLRVVEDATARFGLDRDRIYFTGGSMGGTGALRHGLRHPDVFAAVMAVDGWTDYREWHWHWYARTDARDLIEEFRRPLLEAASPLYWAARGRWANIGHIVDGADTTVLPENGLRLSEALSRLQAADPYTHEQQLVFNPALGHGQGTNYQIIYNYFRARSRTTGRGDFRVQTTVLPHGELYWGRIESFHLDGMTGWLEGHVEGAQVTALTGNLDRFTLLLPASPAADRPQVQVWADGFPCYTGPPVVVTFAADRDPGGQLIGWRQVTEPPQPPAKTPDLAGPIGDAFLQPFVVAWGTLGAPAETSRHRLEAEQFARSWNEFMVHGPGVRAVPEEELTEADLRGKTVVIFGTLDSSSLLRRANLMRELPVQVRRDRVIVRDPVHGERSYAGEQFGAMLCYPNPLADLRTYLVICNRRIFTKPDGQAPQLLGYDLEKLPWAYPDYVVFNLNQNELPFTLNVNNKPPVTCYEAAQYVEAGYFDERWQVDRDLEIRRVRAQKPELHRFIRVADLVLDEGAARVHITDTAGTPVATARVTGRWWGEGERVSSASTDADGWCAFPAPAGGTGFAVVNVMATGATYDWTADQARVGVRDGSAGGQLMLMPAQITPATTPDDPLRLGVALFNALPEARRATVRLQAPDGAVTPQRVTVELPPAGRAHAYFSWTPGAGGSRLCQLWAEATVIGPSGVASATCSVPVWLLPPRDDRVALTEVKGADLDAGSPWLVTVRLTNLLSDQSVPAQVHCALLEAKIYPEAKCVEIPPGAVATVSFAQPPDAPPLERGEYTVRASVAGAHGATATAKFAVR